MTQHTNYVLLSKRGLKELKKTISHLEQQQKEALQQLRELDKGSSREDRMQQIEHLSRLESIESDLADKKATLANAKLLPSKRTRLKVALGSVVDLIDQQGRLVRYTIVESIEANPSDGRISAQSPLGSSLLGKGLEEVVSAGFGSKQRTLKLLSIQ